MSHRILTHSLIALVLVASSLTLACGQSTPSATVAGSTPAPSAPPATAPAKAPANTTAAAAAVPAVVSTPAPAGAAAPASAGEPSHVHGAVAFTGSRDETERFIHHYQTIPLSPEQERIKVEALSTIPAPCCADNPLATCCCPCNMAKAAWGLSAWLITEKGYGVDEVRQAAKDWLAAANPGGFTGDACYSGGCGRAIHQNGCGGMDDRSVL
jgi:hypothetical protein